MRRSRLQPATATGTFRAAFHVTSFPLLIVRIGLSLVVIAAARPAAAQSLVTNAGGVLLLHVVSDAPFEPDTTNPCERLKPMTWDRVRTRIPADGVARLVVVYAAFPKDSTAELAGTCFGLRYGSGVRVEAQGACSSINFELPDSRWPQNGTGIAMTWSPTQVVKPGTFVPVYWFAVSSKKPASFELTPHPYPGYGARFANGDLRPFQMVVADLGAIGFDQDGKVPTPGGGVSKRGGCCLDGCYLVFESECNDYRGIFLGAGSSCDSQPCGPDAIKGACCLPSGCEMHSLYDCARLGGVSLGEGVPCGKTPCPREIPKPGARSGQAPVPDTSGSARPVSEPPGGARH